MTDSVGGLTALEEGANVGEIEACLRRLGAEFGLADRLGREVLRRRAIDELKRLGIAAPGRIVDAALPRPAGEVSDTTGQGSAVTFPEVDQWPEPVDGAALLDSLNELIERFVAMPEHGATAAVLWILFTQLHDVFTISPILAVTSPEKRCGKTTLLELLGALVARPLPASNITTAAVFRIVELCAPTLLIDEADTFVRGNDELRGVLNCGHRRDSAFVIRSVGDDHEPRQFCTWCPKAIACIGDLPETLEDRAIVLRMRRRRSDETVERLRLDRTPELEILRSQMARWAADHEDQLREVDPEIPTGLHDRAADNWRPLLAIADAAGGVWPGRTRQAATCLSGSKDDEQAPGAMILTDIAGLFRDLGLDRLKSDEIIRHLVKLEHRPWPEYKNDKPLSMGQLARLLRRFDIRPKSIRFDDGVLRGYELSDFRDAFARYLPTDPQQAQQQQRDALFGELQGHNNPSHVADPARSGNARRSAFVSDVADESVQSDTAIADLEREVERAGIVGEPFQ